MKNYVEVAYNEKEKPLGEYPQQFADYLCVKYEITHGMKVLDNGCGRGDFLKAFSNRGLKCYGTDTSSFCEGVYSCDLENDTLPFENDFFDVVFSKSVIEHLFKADNFINEMHRVLKPGGLLILMAPDWETQCKIFYQDPTHVHPYTVKSFERLFSMYNFEDIDISKLCQVPSTWNNSFLRLISRCLSLLGPVRKVHKNKFYRFSRELMLIGCARKVLQSEAKIEGK